MYNVLYVDDEPALLKIGKVFLEKSGGINVETALSAEGGLDLMKNSAIDCIVSDYQMPGGMDGLEFLKLLRNENNLIPFILFTGRGREEVVIEAVNNGVDYYLQKGGEPKSQFVELQHKIKLAVEHRRTEKSLIESERKLQGIVQGSPIPQFVIDKNHTVISWNHALEEASGVKAEEIIGTKDAWRAFYPEKRPVLAELLVDETPGKVPDWYSGKFGRSRYVDGAFEAIDFFLHPGRPGVWLFFTAATIRDENGRIIGAVETLEDVTDLKEKERAITEAKIFLDKIIDTIGDPVFVKGRDHRFVLMNDEMCRFMGYPREMLIGKSDYDFFPKNEADIFWQKDEIVFSEGIENINEEQFTDAHGMMHTIVTKKTLYTDAAGNRFIVGVIRDITDRKLTEQKLLESEQKFRAIFNQTYQFIGLMTPDGILIDANKSALELAGIPESAVIGKPFWDTPWWTHSPELQQKVREAISTSAQGGFSRFEATHVAGDGCIHYIDFSLKPVKDGNGRVIWLIPEGRDITERKKAELAPLSESEGRYRQLVENSPDAIVVHSGGRILYINPACARMFGARDASEVLGRPVLDFVAPEMRDVVVKRIRTMTEAGLNVPLLEEKFLRLDGSPIDVEVAAMPIIYDGIPAIQVAFRDITNRYGKNDEQ